MTTQDLIVQEMADLPTPLLEEVLTFLRHLKQRHQRTKSVVVVSAGQESTVTLADVWANELLTDQFLGQSLRPVEQIQQELREALTAAGHNTRSQVIELMQEVKREMLVERLTSD